MSEKGKKKSNQAKRHHYIPRFYLNGFTQEDGSLWMFDLKMGKKSKVHPKNVAWQKDFYRVKVATGEEDIFEKEFAKIEKDSAEVIKRVVSEKVLPTTDSEDYIILMKFIALLRVRTPKPWEASDKFTKEVLRTMIAVMTQSEEIWEAQKRSLQREGVDVSSLTRGQMQEVADEDKYEIEVPKEEYLSTLFDQLNVLIPVLAKRNWSLVFPYNKNYNFICSDFPVVINWTVPMPPIRKPGFGLANTCVLVPLAKQMLMIGSFELPRLTFRVLPSFVALVNRLIANAADRFLFLPDEDFIWLKDDQTIGNVNELIERIKKKHVKGVP